MKQGHHSKIIRKWEDKEGNVQKAEANEPTRERNRL